VLFRSPGDAERGSAAADVLVSSSNANRFADQAYLEGMADFEKGDPGAAAEKFERCLTLGATGQTAGGCLAGLQLSRGELERAAVRAPARAAPSPRRTAAASDDRAAAQSYLEGVVFFQKGDFAKARESWTRCARLAVPGGQTADDCRAGLSRLDQLEGSTASDGKK